MSVGDCYFSDNKLRIFYQPRSGMVIFSVASVSDCLYVRLCISVYTITFESLDVESSFIALRVRLERHGSSSQAYIKVIRSRSRSREHKISKFPIPAM